MRLKLSSNTYTQLTNNINNSQTIITVDSTSNFPVINSSAGEYFYLDILNQDSDYETIKVTAIDELNLTVVRSQAGTVARSFVAGSPCGMRIGKAVIDDLITFDDTYIFNQIAASAHWIITHNLDKYPSVTVVDSAENVVVGDVQYNGKNSLSIDFNGTEFSGKAYLN